MSSSFYSCRWLLTFEGLFFNSYEHQTRFCYVVWLPVVAKTRRAFRLILLIKHNYLLTTPTPGGNLTGIILYYIINVSSSFYSCRWQMTFESLFLNNYEHQTRFGYTCIVWWSVRANKTRVSTCLTALRDIHHLSCQLQDQIRAMRCLNWLRDGDHVHL